MAPEMGNLIFGQDPWRRLSRDTGLGIPEGSWSENPLVKSENTRLASKRQFFVSAYMRLVAGLTPQQFGVRQFRLT